MVAIAKKITYSEFREMEFDDNDSAWYELINGELVRKQAPTLKHQNAADNLLIELKTFARKNQLGKVYSAPLDVFLDDGNAYHPDVLFVKKERFFILDEKEQIVNGAPDLVVEILSKSTAPYDRGDKKDIYEIHGVKEYWLVDPQKKSVEVYSLLEERFRLTQYHEEGGLVKSSVLIGLEIDLTKIFEE